MNQTGINNTLCLLFWLLLLPHFSQGQIQTDHLEYSNDRSDVITDNQWLEELDFITDKIRNVHLKPFANITETSLDSMVQALRINIPVLSDDQVIAGFAKIIASFGWGHTRINLPLNYEHLGFYQGHKLDKQFNSAIKPFLILPIRFVKFDDGVFVQSACIEHRKLLGKRVTHIGGKTIEAALELMKKYVSVENESALYLMAPIYLSISNFLFQEGISVSSDVVTISFNDGSTASLRPLDFNEKAKFIDVLSDKDLTKPLWLTDTYAGMWQVARPDRFWTEKEQYFWYKHIQNINTLYLKINYIAEHPDMSLADFMHRVMKVAEDNKVDKIILDLRHNTGGIGDSNRAIVLALQRWSKISEFGSTYVIVGRQTYSAAILLAMELEEKSNVIFIGEELGGKPAHIGDSKRFVLTHSGLTFRVSVAEHLDWTGLANRSSTWLHFPIPMTFKDYISGTDAALNFALDYNPSDLNKEIVEIYKNTNINVAILVLYHMYTDPREANTDHAEVACSLGRYILEKEENIPYAKYITDVSLEYNYYNIPLLLLKAEISMADDDSQQAEVALDRILTIVPKHPKAMEYLEILK